MALRGKKRKAKNKEKMQQTTALYKQLNFSVSNIRKLKKSIRHSLQLIDKLHFDPSLTDRSWLYAKSGRTKNLSDIPEGIREGISDDLISDLLEQIEQFKIDNSPTEAESERQKLTKAISARRTDLKKEINKGNYTEEQKLFVENLLSNGLEVSEKLPENIDILEGTKAKKIAAKVIQLHNARILKPTYKAPLCGRTVVMQESFFKFPIHNGVTLEDNDYHAILTGYYAKYFPQYDIKMAVFHGNEKGKGEPDFNNHCHIFTSTYNKETKKYDFLDREIEQANAYAKAKGLEGIDRKNLDNLPLLGELRQKMFYEYAQEYLNEHKRNVELYFLPDTEQRREQRKLIKKQDKLPKEQRFYNQINHQRESLDETEKRLIETENNLKKIKKHLQESMETDQKNNEEHLIFVDAELARAKEMQDNATAMKKEVASVFIGMVDVVGNFLIKISQWTKAIISAEKSTAKTIRDEIENELKELETATRTSKFREVMEYTEITAEAAEYRFNVEEKLKISPIIKQANEKAKIKNKNRY